MHAYRYMHEITTNERRGHELEREQGGEYEKLGWRKWKGDQM